MFLFKPESFSFGNVSIIFLDKVYPRFVKAPFSVFSFKLITNGEIAGHNSDFGYNGNKSITDTCHGGIMKGVT